MASTDDGKCVVCGVDDCSPLSTLGEKGCQSIIESSKVNGEDVNILPGQRVHPQCRRRLCHPNLKRQKTSSSYTESVLPNTRTRLASTFDYKTKCLFCTTSAAYSRGKIKRTHDVHPVMTLEFQKSIKNVCLERNDNWANLVLGRIEYANDLPSVEARYHHACCSNFRTGYKIPKHFQTEESNDTPLKPFKPIDDGNCSEPKKGRPICTSVDNAFRQVLQQFEEDDTGQLTINDMIRKMEDLCGESYSSVYMKRKILDHYNGSVIVTELNGKTNVVTFKSKGHEILHKFYMRTSTQNSEDEKMSIIQTAGKLISNDINSMDTSRDNYPSPSNVKSLEENIEFIGKSLKTFLQQIIKHKDSDSIIASIGQAIIQAAMPRKIMSPLQLGLGVQLHYHFGSKFLIDTLNAMGFCSSYQEVQKFETSAALTIKSLVEKSEEQFLQFVGDNVDHNSATIDGHNTFHGMGIIATVTPKNKRFHIIPRVHSTNEDLIEIGKINIKMYYQTESVENTMDAMLFKKIDCSKARPALNDMLEILVKISRPLRQTTPGWSGVMQAVNKGNYPGQTEIVFLPMIDLNPSDLSCIYSTLLFVAKECERVSTIPVITFDQPLYWKAFTIVENEPLESEIKHTVVRLGGFHTEMCFLGSIGNLMENSGLSELLSTVYAANTVEHMLNGKAVGRAIRGYFLVLDALDRLLVEQSYPEPPLYPVKSLMDSVMNQTQDLNELKNNNDLIDLKGVYDKTRASFQESRTGKLWIQYMDMVETLKGFIAAERTANWTAHLAALESMLPYFAAAGNNLYLKSSYVYLQQMICLEQTHPKVHEAFLAGHHVVRCSDRFWSGLSTDLTIEQSLMRSLKSVGGMTRGRGMSEAQRAQWILSMPDCAEMNCAMQEFTSKKYQTSDQHKDNTKARIERDNKDRETFIEFLRERNPFDGREGLMNIDSGVHATKNVNVDVAKHVGQLVISQMENKLVCQYKFKRTSQATTMGTKIKIDGEECAVDPQVLFQRLLAISDNKLEDTEGLFKYELSTYPAALFDSSGLMREPQKSQLANSIWELGNCLAEKLPDDCTIVLDGGSLIQRIPWNYGSTFDSICTMYCEYIIHNKYQECHIVFDGYPNRPTTKDTAHERRTKGKTTLKTSFNPKNPCKMKKDAFLGNSENKQNFISLLAEHLTKIGCKVHHAVEDADLLIVITAVVSAENNDTVLIGEDTDLLVLLCYHANTQSHRIFFRSDLASKKKKVWDITATKSILGEELCKILPVIHAFTGCDTVSRIFGIGKSALLKKAKKDGGFRRNCEIFLQVSSPDDVEKAGENLLVCLYNGKSTENLDALRHSTFLQKVSTRNTVVQVQCLPPTRSAAKYHSFRTYSQVQTWLHGCAKPTDWGWYVDDSKMVPVRSDLPSAPERLLKIIRCNCRVNCDSRRCSCRKHGLVCTVGCGECKGMRCSNSQLPDDDVEEL